VPVLPRIVSLWRNLIRRDRVDRDLDDEIRAAFESVVEDHLHAGLRPEDARRAARLQFGTVAGVKERVQDVRAGASLGLVEHDLRYAARLLRRSPGFTLVAALSIAIGIGAVTTIFTVANGLLLRAPSGVSNPDRLVDVFRAVEGQTLGNFTSSYPYFQDVRGRSTTLADVFAYELEPTPITVGASDGTELAFANLVSANYFGALGVVPAAGRFFASTDAVPGASPVAVLSYRLWQRRFNSDDAVVGARIQVNRHRFTVLGIAPDDFRGTNLISPDLWAPMESVELVRPRAPRLTSRMALDLGMGGRLKPSVSRAQAAAELDTIARDIEREHPAEERGIRLRVATLTSAPGPLATVVAGLLALLLALVSTVLVIACANVSGVVLARAAARRREVAVRIAIGAGRGQLIRQLLTETMLLFALGGAAGLLLARVMTSLLLSLLPAFPVPVDISLPLDARVVAFTIGVSLIAAVLSGVAPALHASKADVVVALKDESQGPSDRLRMRSAFVIAQVAFSSMLVVIAALLAQALHRMGTTNQSFDPHGVEQTTVDLSAAGYANATGAAFARDLVDRLRAVPGVEAATLSQWMPGRGGTDVNVTVPGVAPPDGASSFTSTWNAVESDFFRTLHVSLLAGRDFTSADALDREPVTIVSDTTARYLWPGQDAIGRYITWHEPRAGRPEMVTALKVVGVVPDLRSAFGAPRRSAGRVTLMMYVPLRQRYTPRLTVLARTSGARRMPSEIGAVVKAMDPNLPMMVPQPLDSQMGPVYLQVRVAASVAGTVGLIGVLLAAVGVYGVTAYTTQSRTREIGVRIALGAQRGDVVRMVLREGMSLVGVGSLAGLALAAAGSRLFGSLLAGVPPFDPRTFAATAALLGLIGLAACYLPARRATEIDAMEALRYE
jgi:predicted permease